MRRSTHNEGESQREKKIRKEIKRDISLKRFLWLLFLECSSNIICSKLPFFHLTVFSFLTV